MFSSGEVKDVAHPLTDINTASCCELQQRLNISAARAALICQHRQSVGSFRSVECLRSITGATPRFIERISHLVTCSSLSPHTSDGGDICDETDEDYLMAMPTCSGVDSCSNTSPADHNHTCNRSDCGIASSMTKRKSITVDTSHSPSKKPCLSSSILSSSSAPAATVSAKTIIVTDDGIASSVTDSGAGVSAGVSPVASTVNSPAETPCKDVTAACLGVPQSVLHPWLDTYLNWNGPQRVAALDQLLDISDSSQVRHILHAIQPRFQRDFIALLPRELALHVLSYLPARDLLRAACTCRSWRQLAEDNLLWREKCRELQLDDMQELIQVRRRNTIRGDRILCQTVCAESANEVTCHSDDCDSCATIDDDCGAQSPASPNSADTKIDGCCRATRSRVGDETDVSTNAAQPTLWKQTYIRRMKAEANWRSRPLPEPKVLSGHDDHVITCLQFSGGRVVSGSDDNTLKVWSASTGRCLRTLVGHTGGVWSSQMNSCVVISGSTDRTLKIWNIDSGVCLHTLYGHSSTVRCMHLHGKKVVSGSRDATLRLWDVDSGECEHVLVGHVAAVRCVQYNGRLVVSGAYDYMVKVWRPESEQCLHTLQGHNNRVYSLQFDGVHVVSGSLDTSIRVWDVETGQCRHTLMGHQSLTSGMELRNNILVSGNADSTVKVWDITNGQCLQTLSGPNKHQSAVTCLQFQNNFVVTSSDDGTVKLWDVKSGEFVRNLVSLASGGSGGVVWRIRASRTKLVCAVGSRNGTEETKLLVLDFEPYK